jgi:AcrR family transcriptional regulator
MGKTPPPKGYGRKKSGRQSTRYRSAKGKHTREQILAAALRLFRQKGYPGTSMSDIADAAGLTKGGLYHHVDKKEDLLRELFDETINAVLDRMKRFVDPERDSKRQLERYIQVHASIMHDYPDQVGIFITEVDQLDEKTLRRIMPHRDAFHMRLADILQRGMEGGEFREGLDPNVTALLILGTLNWLYLWYRPKGELSIEGIADQAIRLICHGVYKEE